VALRSRQEIEAAVRDAVDAQPIFDVHTHLYPPGFGALPGGGLMLWGIDELLTYHYLVAEVFRVVPSSKLSHESFWRLSKAQQADHVWRHLFVERSPISEACRGVVTTLTSLGLDPDDKDLAGYRRWYAQQRPEEFVGHVLGTAGVKSVTMTNNVFDDQERRLWETGIDVDLRFKPAMRLDPLLLDLPSASAKLRELGYHVTPNRTGQDAAEGRRFLGDWINRTGAIYCAASLPPEFAFPVGGGRPGADETAWGLEQIVLPVCKERRLPLALMIGARRGVNPDLRDAGDGSGSANVSAVARLCAAFPGNKFLVTMLSRENQHELAVTARKFDNLMIFGCWWFLNTPSLIEEITRMRLELLGLSFIPQHSDARVLEQLIYKWHHTRQTLGRVLSDVYVNLHVAGAAVTADAIERDVRLLLHDNFTEFLAR
jgi:hypothetical protein